MAVIPICLPAIVFVLLVLILARKPGIGAWIDALVKGHILFLGLIAILTEVLSSFQSLALPTLLFAWLLLGLICILTAFFICRRRQPMVPPPFLPDASPYAMFLLGAIGLLLVSTLATAFLYPPNTWDSMTYHMARVVNWINNKSVSFYPTAILRQNYQMPLAEFAIAHLQILSGSDFFANLVQWFSFFVSICLASRIAAELGLDKRLQLIASVTAATLPMAILQSTGTQNDLVVTGLVMSFALFMLRMSKNRTVENMVFASLALGLALLTKGTAYLYCATIGISLSIPMLLKAGGNRQGQFKIIAGLVGVCIIAVMLNTGHFLRNYRLYGHPLTTEGELYRNEKMSIPILISNIMRNIALHLGTPSSQINRYTYRATQLALGKELNNPQTTFKGQQFIIPFGPHEDMAGNIIHLFLGLLAMVAVFINNRQCDNRTKWYAVSLLGGAFIYCGLLKWQPWASRLHTPLFALSAPLIAAATPTGTHGLKKYAGTAVVVLMICYGFYFAFANYSRPLIYPRWVQQERAQHYFRNKPWLYESYRGAVQVLKKAGVQQAGLKLGWDDWEYPFWVLANSGEPAGAQLRFFHVGVSNISKKIKNQQPMPAYIVVTRKLSRLVESHQYAPVYVSPHVNVLRKVAHD